MKNSSPVFKESMLAYCGLYCEQCSFKSAHDDNDTKHFENIPYSFERKEPSVYNCEGCKGYCICGVCKIKPCASGKNIISCADCDDFPCEHIETFENDGLPHHKTAIENLKSIRQFGIRKWFDELKPLLRCKQCGERQSWYYVCPKHDNF